MCTVCTVHMNILGGRLIADFPKGLEFFFLPRIFLPRTNSAHIRPVVPHFDLTHCPLFCFSKYWYYIRAHSKHAQWVHLQRNVRIYIQYRTILPMCFAFANLSATHFPSYRVSTPILAADFTSLTHSFLVYVLRISFY